MKLMIGWLDLLGNSLRTIIKHFDFEGKRILKAVGD